MRRIARGVDKLTKRVIRYWPVSGTIPLEFYGIRFKMYSKGDDHIVNSLYYGTQYSEDKDLRFFLSLVKRSTVVFDIGANTGLYSILSCKTNPGASVFSFEPYPVNIDRLTKNCHLNNIRNEIVPRALGDTKTFIKFAVPSNNSISDTSSAIQEFSQTTYEGKIKWKSIEVEQTTLDSFVEEKKIMNVDLMKIDVEGYEQAVFKGGTEFFRRFSPIIQCEILLDEERKIFFENFIRQNGYTAYFVLQEGLLRIDTELPYSTSNSNYLFAKKRMTSQYTEFNNVETLADEFLSN